MTRISLKFGDSLLGVSEVVEYIDVYSEEVNWILSLLFFHLVAVRTLCGHGPQAHIGGWTFAHGRNLRRYDASC